MKAAKRFKTQERERQREKSNGKGKKSEEKEQKICFEEETVDVPFESNINTAVKKYLIRNFTC